MSDLVEGKAAGGITPPVIACSNSRPPSSVGLVEKIISEIRDKVPMAVDRYMEICNSHYYASRDPFGSDGDFITAPEISQIFGEIIGIWAITAWQKMGSPEHFALVEFGPGRGTLMADLLRAAKVAPLFKPEIHLVETSPILSEVQKSKLRHSGESQNLTKDPAVKPQDDVALITWHTELPDLDIPYIAIANEFFDALPIKQFVRGRERKIIVENEKLAFDLVAEDELIEEICPLGAHIMEQIAKTATAGIIIDYGYNEDINGNSLQAVKGHKYQNVLENPGNADLTAHVNFLELSKILTKFSVKNCNITTQREFLLGHGADVRAKLLGKEADLNRLIDSTQMGELFKVLCF